MTTFADLQLIEPLRQALDAANYREPTPIQAAAIPPILAGRDVLGIAQTGTGKTAAFALPVLQHLSRGSTAQRPVRALVLSPTRELALQIGESFGRYGAFLDIRSYTLYGGVPESPQVRALKEGQDLLVATPGRLLELARKGHVALDRVGFFVLDEADRMLDLGFSQELRRVLTMLPRNRQSLLFSATMPPAIAQLATDILRDPVRLEVGQQATPVDTVVQQVMYLAKADKPRLITHLLTHLGVERGLVFTRTKRGADALTSLLQRADLPALAIHGDLTQHARTTALEAFRSGAARVLVATDVAARGIDVDGVSHVFNYELPAESETYVHRIGRTARAGRQGLAIALCDETEGGLLRDIERLTGLHLIPIFDQPWHSHAAVPSPDATGTGSNPRARRGRR